SYQAEDEQLELLNNLWKRHWITIVLIIVVFSGAVYGYRTWKNYRHSQNEEAASLYLQITRPLEHLQTGKTLTKKQTEQFKHVVSLLEKNHPKSSYTQYARLMEAKQAVDENKFKEAEKLLNYVIDHANDNQIKVLATIRLAMLMIKDNKDVEGAKKSLKILQSIPDDEGFTIPREDAMGDSYYILGQMEDAYKAYKKAYDYTKKEGVDRPFVKMKLDNIEQTRELNKQAAKAQAHQQVAKENTAKPAAKENAQKQIAKADSHSQPVKENTTKPAVKENAQKQVAKADSHSQPVKENTTKPTAKEDTQKQVAKAGSHPQSVKENMTKPAVKEDTQKQIAKADSHQQNAKEDAIKQITNEKNQEQNSDKSPQQDKGSES
ncbi:MAG: tetratricopeptide repeat protein, partial [Endozoicomonadaceae bacterium]|nr:tetratricopeptide repeat protein [Endozoicomonadaceae bacterium]